MKYIRSFVRVFSFSALFSVLFAAAGNAAAASNTGTVITIQDKGQLTSMLTDGKQARLNTGGGEYSLIDLRQNTVKIVNPQQKTVMLFHAGNSQNKKNTAGRGFAQALSLRETTGVESVAGYPTRSYQYSVNGRTCGTIVASKSAMKVKGVKELLDAMQVMIDSQREMLGGFAALMDQCRLADLQLTESVSSIGVPMRKIENGQVVTEVKRIETDVLLPKNSFRLPSGYQLSSINQQSQQSTQSQPSSASTSAADKMPGGRSQGHYAASYPAQAATVSPSSARPANRSEMMHQLQQSGELTPQMMEQMRRSQGMMQQYQHYQRPGY